MLGAETNIKVETHTANTNITIEPLFELLTVISSVYDSCGMINQGLHMFACHGDVNGLKKHRTYETLVVDYSCQSRSKRPIPSTVEHTISVEHPIELVK